MPLGVGQLGMEPMEMDDPVNANPHHSPLSLSANHQVQNATLDVEAYATGYSGMGKVQRLLYVADHCPSLRIEALNLVLRHLQDHTHNTHMYQTCFAKLLNAVQDSGQVPAAPGGPPHANGGGGPDLLAEMDAVVQDPGRREAGAAVFDQQWLEATAKRAALKLEKLDSDLKHYKANSIKESIRRGQDDLGEHYLDCGDLNNALKCFSRSRDYCTSSRHILAMCFNVIKVSVYLRNWSLVLSYVSRAETSPEVGAVSAASGLSNAISVKQG